MVDSIQRAFGPLASVGFVLGLGNFKYPLSYWRFRLCVFYTIIVWSFYTYAFHVMLIGFSPVHIFDNPLTLTWININILITIVSVTITICKQQKIQMCTKRLCLVDDTLEKLGTPKEYHTIQKLMRLILIIYFLMIFVLFVTDSIWNIERNNNDIKAIIIGPIVGYPFYVSTLGDIMFVFVLRYLGTRMDKINDYIEQLSETEECGLRCKWKKSIRYYVRSAENRKHVLWIVMHLHSELCHIAREINNLFGTQITLEMISYFIVTVIWLYIHYHMIMCLTYIYVNDTTALKFMLSNDMWFMVLLTKFISVNYFCENVCVKVQKTKALTHKLTDLVRFTEMRKEIYQFLLQMSLRPLEFRGMNVFHFGYKFINKFIIWVVSVIIFILQMDSSPMTHLLKSNGINQTCLDRNINISNFGKKHV